jgi:hypothetical protein
MIPSKRLQFRRIDGVFNTRESAVKYISGLTANQSVFGRGLYGEPIVAKYSDSGNSALILAIGVESGKTYHIIDTYGLQSEINKIYDELENIGNITETDLSDLFDRIAAEELRAQNKEGELSGVVTTMHTTLSELSEDIPLTYATKEELHNNISGVTSTITNHIDDYNNNKIINVVYDDNENNTTYGRVMLEKANGGLSSGFDLKSLLNKSLLTDVHYCAATQTITMIFGDSYSSRIEIPLGDLVDTYTIDSASTAYLVINDNEFHVRVNNESPYTNTLATTSFVDSAVTNGVSEAKIYTDNEVDVLSGSIIAHVEIQNQLLSQHINTNSSAITILNSNYNTPGSVRKTIDDAIIVCGPPINSVVLGELTQHSLLRSVIVGNEKEYFASNSAQDMLFYPTATGTPENLNEYIKTLQNRINYLESVIGDMNNSIVGSLPSIIKNVVKGYLSGTPKEIKVEPNQADTILQIGFTDDAIFGPVND